MIYNNTKKQILAPLVLSLVLLTGVFLGGFIFQNNTESENTLKIDINNNNKLNLILKLIEYRYVDTLNIDKLVESSISKILEQLDPHSVYIPANELQDLNEEIEGSFGGVGVQFSILDDTVNIIQVISGGPSEKAGLMPGDKIVAVDDSSFVGEKVTNRLVMKKLKGAKGTRVSLDILRKNADKTLNYEIIRGDIPLQSVDVSYMIDENIGYVKIGNFGTHTHKEFVEGVEKLKKQKCKKLIVDLRNNPGGLLSTAVKIADEILKKDKLIVFTEGKSQPRQNSYATSRGICQDMEIVILINEWSASASEIVAGAIQDNDRGIVIGRRSFGKGLVQDQIPLGDGSAVRLTIAKYYTPLGRSIQKPYNNGVDDYHQDLLNRYNHGEFLSKDSIELKDTTQFVTSKGKIIYGGGGIMPDVFVPLDTVDITPFYTEITNQRIVYQVAYNYANNHRKILNKYTNFQQFENNLNEKELEKELLNYVRDKKIAIDYNEYEKSKFIITIRMKAFIARNIIGEEGFYPIFRKIDKPILEAIGTLSE